MTLYAIYDPKPGKSDLPAAIPERFSWFAAILPPLFLLAHRLWLELIGFVVAVAALILLSAFIGDDAAFLLYLLGAAWLGFAAAGMRRHALQWRGWTHRGSRVAPSADIAQLEAMR